MKHSMRFMWMRLVFMAAFLPLLLPQTAQAAGAANSKTVLILSSSVYPAGSPACWEAVQATALGFTVEFASDAQWAAKSQADFATYRALILGDASASVSLSTIQAAINNKDVWGPAVNGNIILIGGDPEYHAAYLEGPRTLIYNAIKFAGDITNKTGLYVAFTYYYNAPESGSPIPWLDHFGSFAVRGIGWEDIHMVAVHPALAGLTDAALSNWGTSTHEGFTVFPDSFTPLAIQRGATGNGALTFADGSSGTPFLLARGEGLQPVGLNISKSGPASAAVGDEITYTITYGNSGGTAAANVVLRDPLPTGTTFVSATGGGTLAGDDVTWNVGALNAGVTGQTVQFTVRIGASGSIINQSYTIAADGVAAVTGASVETTVAGPTSFTVTFATDGTADAAISGAASQTVASGGSASAVTAVAPASHHFVNWTGSNGFVTTGANPLTVSNITANMAITAHFAVNTYTVNATAGANGSISPSGAVQVDHGASQSFTITPSAHHHVADVLVDGSSVGAVTGYTFSNVTAAHTIAATFAGDTYTVTASAGVNGTLSPDTPSPRTVQHGDTVAFTFLADPGHHVASVSGSGGTPYSNSANGVAAYTYTSGAIHDDSAVTATFAVNVYSVAFARTGRGWLKGNLSQRVAHGNRTGVVTAMPDPGYRLLGWTGSYAGKDNPLVLRQVIADMNVKAVFANDPPRVSIQTPAPGARVYGLTAVKAGVSDDTGIVQVEFYVDGRLKQKAYAPGAASTVDGAEPSRSSPAEPPLAADAKPLPLLESGAWTFDLRGAEGIFLTSDRKARKIGGDGRVSPVMLPDLDVERLHWLPELNALAVAFARPQSLADGRAYSLMLADFAGGRVIGLEKARTTVVGGFSSSPSFQAGGGALYYLTQDTEGPQRMRRWDGERTATLFAVNDPVREWRASGEGALLVTFAAGSDLPPRVDAWHPRLGWIGDNLSLLDPSTVHDWNLAAVGLGDAGRSLLAAYFPERAAIGHGVFDCIQAMSLREGVVLIAGTLDNECKIERFDRNENALADAFVPGLRVDQASWIDGQRALLAGYLPGRRSYVLSRLAWSVDGSAAVDVLCRLEAPPLQLQGVAAAAGADRSPGATENGDRAGAEETAAADIAGVPGREAAAAAPLPTEGTFSFTWDAASAGAGNHVIKVIAMDQTGAKGSASVTVSSVQVGIALRAQRLAVRSFGILREYGQIQFSASPAGLPVAQYHILRKAGRGAFSLLKTVPANELQGGAYSLQDKYLEKRTAYTYRVEARDAGGLLLGTSPERTI